MNFVMNLFLSIIRYMGLLAIFSVKIGKNYGLSVAFLSIYTIFFDGNGWAYPASFDCTKSLDLLQRNICSDSLLSSYDGVVKERYEETLHSLSVDAAKKLEENQKLWQQQLIQKCPLSTAENVTAAERFSSTKCLRKLYGDRLNELRRKVSHLPDERHLFVLYSEDDALCDPLAHLLDRLNHITFDKSDNKSVQFKDWLWEDSSQDDFRKIGLSVPQYLSYSKQDEKLALREKGMISKYYKISFDEAGIERMVLVMDVPYMNHGAFSTDVTIWKPGVEITGAYADQEAADVDRSPEKISLFVNFGGQNSDGVNSVSLPYIITDDGGNKFYKVDKYKIVYPNSILNASSPIIQRMFLRRGYPIFIARQIGGGNALVYMVRGEKMVSTCVIGNLANVWSAGLSKGGK